jgi:hypothetical protein
MLLIFMVKNILGIASPFRHLPVSLTDVFGLLQKQVGQSHPLPQGQGDTGLGLLLLRWPGRQLTVDNG